MDPSLARPANGRNRGGERHPGARPGFTQQGRSSAGPTRGDTIMVRVLAGAVLAVAVCTAVCLADEVKGTVKKVEKGKITVTVDGKDTTYIVQKDARILNSTTTKA